jgi:hypothetical protein
MNGFQKNDLSLLVERLRDGRCGFRDSVAKSMAAGWIPRGRTRQVMMEILAEQVGRRGSTGYYGEIDRISNVLWGIEND